jgi:3-oxoadipate enol-lactonase
MSARTLLPELTRVPGPPELAVLHAGQGELVLFLHGVGGNKGNWARQVQVFSAHCHAAAWDMRGYHESEDFDGPMRFEDLSADVLRVLAHFGAPAAHLVGLSMGGRIAFDFLHRHPGRVLSLTVCSASHRASEMTPERRAAFLASRLRPLREEGKTPADIAPAVARSLVGPQATESAYQALVESMRSLRTGSYMKALEATSAHDSGIVLESIRVPTHVVAAAQDTLIPPQVMRPMAQRIPGSLYSEIPDSGHLSNLEQPQAFDRAVLGFLKEQFDPTRSGLPCSKT